MKQYLTIWLAVIALLGCTFIAEGAHAQADLARAASACGTPGYTPVTGSNYPITLDSGGRLCMSGSVTIGGTVVAVGPDAQAAAPTGNPLRIAGWDGVFLRTLLTDGNGRLLVTTVPSATSGVSVRSTQVANNTTSVVIDASPGTLYGLTVFNNSATIAYAKLYNAAQGSTTCGSGTPVQRVLIPASTSGAGAVIPLTVGVVYSTAITLCVTTGFADADTAAPAASTYIVEAVYK